MTELATGESPTVPPTGSVPVLEMTGVTVGAMNDPSVEILREVDWAVQAGDYWAVAGLHRSGKTDLLAVAAGVARPRCGAVRVSGCELSTGIEHERLSARLQVGMVFDGGQLFHHLTLAENIALPLQYHAAVGESAGAARIESLIEFTGLAAWSARRPAQVSRNWQQRIGLARALALKPRLLLLDNPLSGLDPRDIAWWLEHLDALAGGHELLNGKPLTLVVTGDDFRPWQNRARQFALLSGPALHILGGREELRNQTHPLMQVLLDPPVPH